MLQVVSGGKNKIYCKPFDGECERSMFTIGTVRSHISLSMKSIIYLLLDNRIIIDVIIDLDLNKDWKIQCTCCTMIVPDSLSFLITIYIINIEY